MRAEQTSFLFGANAPFIEELYERYLGDPNAVDAEWRTFFEALGEPKSDVLAEVRGASWAPNGAHVIGAVDPDSLPPAANRLPSALNATPLKGPAPRPKSNNRRPVFVLQTATDEPAVASRVPSGLNAIAAACTGIETTAREASTARCTASTASGSACAPPVVSTARSPSRMLSSGSTSMFAVEAAASCRAVAIFASCLEWLLC